jgi:hypothetical protein
MPEYRAEFFSAFAGSSFAEPPARGGTLGGGSQTTDGSTEDATSRFGSGVMRALLRLRFMASSVTSRWRKPAAAILLLLAVCLVAAPSLQAQEGDVRLAAVRGAEHDGFARLVFEWNQPVRFSARSEGNRLIIAFERPAVADPRPLLRAVSKYLRGVSVSPDRMSFTFEMDAPRAIRSFSSGALAVVDVLDQKQAEAKPQSQPAAKPGPAAAPPSTAAQPKPPVAAAPAAKSSAKTIDLPVRSGEHTGYNRLVFDWPTPVEYSADKQDGKARITFRRPANINVTALRAGLPSDVKLDDVQTSDATTTLTLQIPPDARLRHFLSGPKVVVDIVRPAAGSPPPEVATGKAVPLAPAPNSGEVALPQAKAAVAAAPSGPSAAKPDTPAPDPRAPAAPGRPVPLSDLLAKLEKEKSPEQAPRPAAPMGQLPPPMAKAAPPEPPMPAKAPEKPPLRGQALPAVPAQSSPPPTAEISRRVTLPFSWTQAAAAAAFRRAGWLWIVFDRPQQIDVKRLKQMGGDVVEAIEQVPHKDATLIRVITKPGFNPSLRREGFNWLVDLQEQTLEAARPIAMRPRLDPQSLPSLLLSSAEGGSVVRVLDPEVGDTMLVVPVVPVGNGITPGRDFIGFEILPSAQGIAVVPKADGVEVNSGRAGVEIVARAGLQMSRDLARRDPVADDGPSRELDPARWKRGGPAKFLADKQALERRLLEAAPDKRNDIRMDIARHYMANGFGADSLGVLQVVAGADPTIVDTPHYRALRGATNFLLGRYIDAVDDLNQPSLANLEEVGVWRGATAAALGQGAQNASLLRPAGDLIKDYAKPLKFTIATLAAEALLDANDERNSKRLIDMLTGIASDPFEKAHVAFLQGRDQEFLGATDAATMRWREAEESGSRVWRAKAALRRIEMQLRTKKISRKEAIAQLDKLRFAWRDPEFEYRLLRRLGELQIAEGDYGEGLRTLRQLAEFYPENPDIPQVARMMTDAFTALFRDGAATNLSPVAAIGLYDEFRELTPAGPGGDEMIRKLADRLVAVDLLDRAGELLRHQVNFRLSGLDRARVGNQLALVELLNRQPQQAMEALQVSDYPQASAELRDQRRLLLGRALHDLNRSQDALSVLANDVSPEAIALRGEINWSLKDWAGAAAALEQLVPRPERGQAILPEPQARMVLDIATALTLANDERGVQRIRRIYGPLMAASPYRDAFALLSSDLERGVIDYRRVGDKIKEVESFKTFLTSYRQKLQQGGLSAIN